MQMRLNQKHCISCFKKLCFRNALLFKTGKWGHSHIQTLKHWQSLLLLWLFIYLFNIYLLLSVRKTATYIFEDWSKNQDAGGKKLRLCGEKVVTPSRVKGETVTHAVMDRAVPESSAMGSRQHLDLFHSHQISFLPFFQLPTPPPTHQSPTPPTSPFLVLCVLAQSGSSAEVMSGVSVFQDLANSSREPSLMFCSNRAAVFCMT